MEKRNIDKSQINKILDGADSVILMTRKGCAMVGNGIELLVLFSNIGAHLKQNGIEEKDLEEALKIGFEAVDIASNENKCKDFLKNGLSSISDFFAEILGDKEDE